MSLPEEVLILNRKRILQRSALQVRYGIGVLNGVVGKACLHERVRMKVLMRLLRIGCHSRTRSRD